MIGVQKRSISILYYNHLVNTDILGLFLSTAGRLKSSSKPIPSGILPNRQGTPVLGKSHKAPTILISEPYGNIWNGGAVSGVVATCSGPHFNTVQSLLLPSSINLASRTTWPRFQLSWTGGVVDDGRWLTVDV